MKLEEVLCKFLWAIYFGCRSIKCQFSISICFKLVTDGWYCLTKGKILFCLCEVFVEGAPVFYSQKSLLREFSAIEFLDTPSR